MEHGGAAILQSDCPSEDTWLRSTGWRQRHRTISSGKKGSRGTDSGKHDTLNMANLLLNLLEHGDGQQCRWEAGRHVCIWQTWMSVTFAGRRTVGEWACLLSNGHIWWQHNSPECKEWQMSECGQPFWECTLQLSVNNVQQRIWRTWVSDSWAMYILSEGVGVTSRQMQLTWVWTPK